MRSIILFSLTIGVLAVIVSAPAEAVGTRYPYCLRGRSSPGLSNCTFDSPSGRVQQRSRSMI